MKVGKVDDINKKKTEKERVKDFKKQFEVKPSKNNRMKRKEDLMKETRDYIDR